MNNTVSARAYIQSFLLTLFILTLTTGSTAFAENTAGKQQYITAMENAVNQYKTIVKNGGWPSLKIGETIKVGEKDYRLPKIRQILTITGDYKESNIPEAHLEIFDEGLIEAVKSFQTRHGLETDGAIGGKTQTALAISAEFRLAQLEATLEKMQEIPELGEHYILVNIPAFQLRAIDKHKTILVSRIIVGKPENSTPLFQQPITEVIFNPKWYVPDSIARKEFVGKILSEPDYLEKGNYIVKTRDGKTVNHSEIDWQNVSGDEYKFIQRAGDGNALGKIKFNLPHTNNIYLHSTSSPKLFNRPERALSHGCIRVERARELAYFVIEGLDGWDRERINKFYDGSVSRVLKVNPVSVYLTYWTSWIDENSNQPYFYKDIYGRDANRISEILATIKMQKE